MNPNITYSEEVVDTFTTFDGMVYRLVKTVDGKYQVRRNHTIFHTCNLLMEAKEKFDTIKKILKKDHLVNI